MLNHQVILHIKGADAPRLRGQSIVNRLSVQDFSAPDGRRGERFHKWQKPDALAQNLIELASDPGDTVFDPFCGSGTFPIVAARLRRVALGCDTDRDALALADKRGAVICE